MTACLTSFDVQAAMTGQLGESEDTAGTAPTLRGTPFCFACWSIHRANPSMGAISGMMGGGGGASVARLACCSARWSSRSLMNFAALAEAAFEHGLHGEHGLPLRGVAVRIRQQAIAHKAVTLPGGNWHRWFLAHGVALQSA